MVFRKRAFALQAGGNGRAQQFGEPFQIFPRARVVNSLPRVDEGMFRFDQCGGSLAHIGDIGPVARGDRWLVDERPGNFFREEVHGNFNQRRSAAPVAQVVKKHA